MKGEKRRSNLGAAKKEKQMAEVEKVNGLAVAAEPSGLIQAPENTPHYYDPAIPHPAYPGLFTLQVTSSNPDSQGNRGPEFPEQYQAPGYRRPIPIPNTNKPDWIKVGAPPDPFTPGWTDNPATNPAAKWVVGIDSNGDYIYGPPPVGSGSLPARAAQLAALATELSRDLAQPK
jgi:hypothetical protein